MPGSEKKCEDCGETYHGGTDLSKYGCRCLKAKYSAAKANREALGDQQPQLEATAEGQVGGKAQCEDCWGTYSKGTNLRLYGCPCIKAKLEAVFAEPEAKAAESEKVKLGGQTACADCGESYHRGTDLSKYGCRCLKAKYSAAKANRAALGDQQPLAAPEGQQIGGQTQCDDCWGFYNKGTNLRLYGCPCVKAKLEAVFAEPAVESKGESSEQPEKRRLGGPKKCDDCGESYHGGTDLSKYGCRCLKAKYTAAKAHRAALGDQQPQLEGTQHQIGGKTQCEDCWGTYNKGTNYRLYGCPCLKAKLEAVFADENNGAAYCANVRCYQLVDGNGNCSACNPAQTPRPGLTRQLSSRSTALMKAFKKFDRNGSGGLDPEEFREVVSKCLEVSADSDVVNQFFKMAVSPGQAEVSFQAFCEFLDVKQEK